MKGRVRARRRRRRCRRVDGGGVASLRLARVLNLNRANGALKLPRLRAPCLAFSLPASRDARGRPESRATREFSPPPLRKATRIRTPADAHATARDMWVTTYA